MTVLRKQSGDLVSKQKQVQFRKMSLNAPCQTICQPYTPPNPTPCGSICVLYCVGK